MPTCRRSAGLRPRPGISPCTDADIGRSLGISPCNSRLYALSTRPMPDESMGDRIRKRRMERGMSLAKVAGGDFSRAYLHQVELGKTQPSTRILRVVADRLGSRVEYLLDGSMPTLDREIALERARIALLQGRARDAVADLESAVDSK